MLSCLIRCVSGTVLMIIAAFSVVQGRLCAVCWRYQCGNCPSLNRHAALQMWLSRGPWDRVSMDILGPLPRAARTKTYILVVTDTLIKCVEAFPISDLDTRTSLELRVREIICQFGLPKILLLDQKRSFEAQVMKDMSEALGVQKTQSAPYHSQGNSYVERLNRIQEKYVQSDS